MSLKEKPYILFVAEKIYLEVHQIKKKNPNCKVIAYCHGGLPSLPIEYFDNKLVDKIYVHSQVEKNILHNFFGWKKKKIILTKSFRHYNKKKNSRGSNKKN